MMVLNNWLMERLIKYLYQRFGKSQLERGTSADEGNVTISVQYFLSAYDFHFLFYFSTQRLKCEKHLKVKQNIEQDIHEIELYDWEGKAWLTTLKLSERNLDCRCWWIRDTLALVCWEQERVECHFSNTSESQTMNITRDTLTLPLTIEK